MKKYPLADAKDHFFFLEKISNTDIKRHTEILVENNMIKEISGVWHYRCSFNLHTWFTPADCLLDAVAFVWDVFRIETIKENLNLIEPNSITTKPFDGLGKLTEIIKDLIIEEPYKLS